jgi:hypothetical protein
VIRAARAGGDTATLRYVAQLLRETGYEDRELREVAALGAAT